MKKFHIVGIGVLLCGSIHINATENMLGVNVGATSIYNENSINLDEFSAGVTYQFNEVNSDIKPRVDLDYVKISDYKNVTSFVKTSVNGVYEFMEDESISPYVMAGLGYEVVNTELSDELDSRAFAQGGMGVVYHDSDFDVQLEGKVLQTFGNERQDNEVIVTAGVSIPVGTLFKGGVAHNECPVKIDGADQDRDGITDTVDQCPNTPCYFSVDAYGCPVKATLRTHFEVNRAIIRPYSLAKIKDFATFLIENKGSKVKVIGHTDSDASDDYNMVLSDKRANAVMEKLIAYGVSSQRLSAEGKGESMPIATNSTDAGKALNRRIEVELSYPTKN